MTKKENPGYHINEISRGVYGEFSKIEEEFMEVQDAWEQRCAIMSLVELSDLVGAMEAYYGEEVFASYLNQSADVMFSDGVFEMNVEEFIAVLFKSMKAKPDDRATVVNFIASLDLFLGAFYLNTDDLMTMSQITKRAFRAGRRVPNN